MKKKLYRSMTVILLISVIMFSVFELLSDFFCYKRYGDDIKDILIIRLVFSFIALVLSTGLSVYFSKKFAGNIIISFRNLAKQIENFNSIENETLEIQTEYDEFKSIAETISGLTKKVDKYKGRWRNESEKIALIFENMSEGMVILNESGYIININKSAVNMFTDNGYISGMTHISSLTDCKELMEFLSDNDKSRTIQDINLENGKKLYAYANRVEISSNDCIIIIFTDVSQKFDAEDLRREFSANVSHELKTPLTTIRGFGELFGSGMITDIEDVKKYGSRIQQESQRLLFLINDIIRLSELDENNEVITDRINLMNIAEEVSEMLANKAESAEVSIIFEGDRNLCCMCNEGYIRELFTNLIDNSIKYNKKGGYVKVGIFSIENQTVISIKDNGIGIPENDTERIFERFYRVDKSHSRQTGGTGLGLSIVKHIVAYHKGTVNLKSELGKGTEITIFLP